MRLWIGILLLGMAFARQEECGENAHFAGCGTACPLTCDNLDNLPTYCVAMCVMGCQCDEGFVKTETGRCVKPNDCPKTKSDKIEEVDCLALPDPGVCRARVPRFYYDPAEERCKEFIYGGCRGNTNNFKTEDDCKAICGARFEKSRTACLEDKKVGPCRGAITSFFFNKQTGQCERFTYGGCEGNSNNFNSKEDCEAVCIN